MFIVICIYAIRGITKSIAITVCSCVVIPVVAHVVCVSAAVVRIRYFFGWVPEVRWILWINIVCVVYEVVEADKVVVWIFEGHTIYTVVWAVIIIYAVIARTLEVDAKNFVRGADVVGYAVIARIHEKDANIVVTEVIVLYFWVIDIV